MYVSLIRISCPVSINSCKILCRLGRPSPGRGPLPDWSSPASATVEATSWCTDCLRRSDDDNDDATSSVAEAAAAGAAAGVGGFGCQSSMLPDAVWHQCRAPGCTRWSAEGDQPATEIRRGGRQARCQTSESYIAFGYWGLQM